MEMETSLTKEIRAADSSAQYDAACKRVLSEKRVLACIMKNCLEEYRDCTPQEIAERYIEGTPQVGKEPVLPRLPVRQARLVLLQPADLCSIWNGIYAGAL